MKAVRLTKRNRTAFINEVDALYQPQINKIVLPVSFWDDIMEDVYIHHYAQYRNVLPEKWYKEIKSIDVQIKVDGNIEYASFNRIAKSYTIPNIGSLFSVNELIIKADQVSSEHTATYATHFNKLKIVREEKEAFKKEAKDILAKCNTTAQLLKLWPQASNIIPASVKQQMQETNVPREKKERNTEINEEVLNTLNTNLLKHTMLNS